MALDMVSQSSFHFDFDSLMMNPPCIRNICILAHVDHGKTTFADSLIASNGIISSRDVGKLNYMDFREDEQIKKITMKSSAISLAFFPRFNLIDHYLINLIDSPGHIDFSAEVSTAVRLSDGAFLIIDVVEGICPQTRSVIKQIYQEHLSPCLVFNKIDKLLLKLHYTPLEAFDHLYQLLEQVNALMASFETFMTSHSRIHYQWNDIDNSVEGLESLETSINTDCSSFFSPFKGNVMFASSFDGWGFKIDNFVNILSDQLGFNKKVLSKTLWGDYFLNPKTQRIFPNARAKGKTPLFASFILDSIWAVYKCSIISKDKFKIIAIIEKLKLDVSVRLLKHTDSRILLQSIMQKWLPLSEAALSMAIEHVPGPQNLSVYRIERLLTNNLYREFEILPNEVKKLKPYFQKCLSFDHIPQVVFVSKMMPFPREAFQSYNSCDNNYCLLAFSRVISGTIRRGQTLYVLHPSYDPAHDDLPEDDLLLLPGSNPRYLPQNVSIVNIEDLFIFMGKELKSVQSVPSGNICGIGGLDDIVFRNCTLSNTLHCLPFCPIYFDSNPILKVSLEPIHISDMDSLVNGLQLLAKVDPCVEIGVEETGERVISCAGEVHLKKCLEDLKKIFTINIELDVSPPIIPFRETIIKVEDFSAFKERHTEESDDKNQTHGNTQSLHHCDFVVNQTPNKEFEIAIRACPLPFAVVKCLEDNSNLLRLINSINNHRDKKQCQIPENTIQEFEALRKKLKILLQKDGNMNENFVDLIWSFGAKANCPNILINNVKGYERVSIWPDLNCNMKEGNRLCSMNFDTSVIQGFQLSTLQGPLCNEPILGVCFIVENVKFENSFEFHTISDSSKMIEKEKIYDNKPFGPLSGQVISTVTKTCKQAFLTQNARLMYPIYSCSLQCTQEALGSMMSVISRRGGKCLCQEIEIGTNIFKIDSYIPVIESFGFSDEIRKKTSGLAIPQLIFSHWEIIPCDPFWVPTTDEELLHFGVKADFENIAKKYMDNIRTRKGLSIQSKVVEFGEKQRNIKK